MTTPLESAPALELVVMFRALNRARRMAEQAREDPVIAAEAEALEAHLAALETVYLNLKKEYAL